MQELEGWILGTSYPWDYKPLPLMVFPLWPGFAYCRFHFISYFIKKNPHAYLQLFVTCCCNNSKWVKIVYVLEPLSRTAISKLWPECRMWPFSLCSASRELFQIHEKEVDVKLDKSLFCLHSHKTLFNYMLYHWQRYLLLIPKYIKKEIPSYKKVTVALFGFAAYRFRT